MGLSLLCTGFGYQEQTFRGTPAGGYKLVKLLVNDEGIMVNESTSVTRELKVASDSHIRVQFA